MENSRSSDLLQTLARILAVGAGLIYVCGFVILSIFDSSYGIADLDPIRTKVVATGVMFAVFVAVAMISTFRSFGILGLTAKHAGMLAPTVSDKNQKWLIVDAALSTPAVGLGLAVPSWLLLRDKFDFRFTGLIFFVLLTATLATIAVARQKHFDRHPFLFVFLSGLVSVGLLVDTFKYTNRTVFWLVAWFTGISASTLYIAYHLHRKIELKTIEWERFFLFVLPCVFAGYALKIYPHVRHEIGGGATVPVVLHLAKKTAGFPSEDISGSLLDETDRGYYLLSSGDKTVFIARGLVEGVEFSRDSLDAEVGK